MIQPPTPEEVADHLDRIPDQDDLDPSTRAADGAPAARQRRLVAFAVVGVLAVGALLAAATLSAAPVADVAQGEPSGPGTVIDELEQLITDESQYTGDNPRPTPANGEPDAEVLASLIPQYRFEDGTYVPVEPGTTLPNDVVADLEEFAATTLAGAGTDPAPVAMALNEIANKIRVDLDRETVIVYRSVFPAGADRDGSTEGWAVWIREGLSSSLSAATTYEQAVSAAQGFLDAREGFRYVLLVLDAS
jgi:hypothetical protein